VRDMNVYQEKLTRSRNTPNSYHNGVPSNVASSMLTLVKEYNVGSVITVCYYFTLHVIHRESHRMTFCDYLLYVSRHYVQ